MRALASVLLFGCAITQMGCGDSVSAQSGANELMIVRNAQFFAGDPPNADPSAPALTQITIRNTQFNAGTAGKAVAGDAAQGSQAVALWLQGVSHGYWLMPVSSPDLNTTSDLTWNALCDFSRDLPTGMQTLLASASGSSGRFGAPKLATLNISPFLPTGHIVASLTWGSAADLDIHLQSPSGKELNPKHPNTSELIDAGDQKGMAPPGSGLLDRDSNAGCVQDGYRTEDVVWQDNPEVGLYAVRVDMFSACGAPAANFTFSLFVDGQKVIEKSGRLLDQDADGGGTGAGLFVAEFTCEESGTCS